MLDALLAHHGLKAHSDPEKYDEPLVQIGDGIDRLKFGVIDLNGDITPENLITTRDIIYVKECINGAPLNDGKEWIGRKDKEYLYDVISNRHSGLDVDKMDYYARDQKRTLSVGQVEFILIEERYAQRRRRRTRGHFSFLISPPLPPLLPASSRGAGAPAPESVSSAKIALQKTSRTTT